MPSRLLATVVGVLLLLAPLPLSAAPGIVGGEVRGNLGTAQGTPVEAAEAALERFEGELGISAEDFVFDSVQRSLVGTHVRGTQRVGGLTVDGTSAAVDIVDGQVWEVAAHGAVGLAGGPSTSPVDRTAAIASALGATGVTTPAAPPSVTRVLVPQGTSLVDTWQVGVFSLVPPVAAEVAVDAATGVVLSVRDGRVRLDGTATVFDPNAIVALKDSTIRQPGEDVGADSDLDSPELTAARTTLPVLEVDESQLAAGRLLGPWADVRGAAGLDADATFEYTRSDPRFETTMAYTHLDRIQRYFQSLGFTGQRSVNAEPQDTYTQPVPGFDNSFYMPAQDLMLFGSGGVDDAEDAEVIIHEYGHAVQDAQVPGWGETHEGGSMGEGFGDFLAGTFYAGTISEGFQDACIADWDATSYSSDDPTCLRRLDGTKHYPEDMEGEVHADGEIWSAFLWQVRSELATKASGPLLRTTLEGGRSRRLPRSELQTANAIRLVLTSHEFLTPQAEFGDAVAALRLAAKAFHRKSWGETVDRVAASFGLPLN